MKGIYKEKWGKCVYRRKDVPWQLKTTEGIVYFLPRLPKWYSPPNSKFLFPFPFVFVYLLFPFISFPFLVRGPKGPGTPIQPAEVEIWPLEPDICPLRPEISPLWGMIKSSQASSSSLEQMGVWKYIPMFFRILALWGCYPALTRLPRESDWAGQRVPLTVCDPWMIGFL